MKKTLIIILIIVAILAVGTGVYFAWTKSRQILTPPTVSLPESVQNQPQSAAVEQSAGRLKAVSGSKISYYWIHKSATSSDIYYFNPDGFLFRVKSGGDEKALSEAIKGIKSLLTDKDGKSVAIKSDNGIVVLTIGANGLIKESFESAVSASFSPNSDRMAYFEASGNLYVRNYSSNLRAPSVSKILTVGFNDAVIQWIDGNKIVLNSLPSAYYRNESWLIDVNRQTIIPFIQARGLYFNWSADGKMAIKFSVDASFNPFLSLIDSYGLVLASLDFSSLPEKCSIGTEKIYCAVSQSNNAAGRLVLPDDYLKKKVYFNDWIYEIDPENRDIKLVYSTGDTAMDAYNLFVAAGRLFFINRYDSKLYELELL
jgi:hypothetical protein